MSANGYISEVDYLYGYYPETSPVRLRLALLASGVGHSVGTAPNYLELGFGQGLSLSINAATNDGNFYGTDFNPAQVANALELAQATGRPISIFEDSFEQLAERTDLPQFDIIALHGIWSWVSDESRRAIVRIARDRLKPGGIFYISYNVTPGWSPAMPLRHLMAEYSKRAATGGILERAQKAINFVDQVMDCGAAYFATHPQLKARLDQIRKQDMHYIAHEYFNAEWEPMAFSKVADILSEAKLSFAGSANILDNIPALSVHSSATEVLSEITDPILRETTLDYFVNRQFRRDIFVKGLRRLDGHQLRATVSQQQFTLLANATDCPSTVGTSVGDAELKQDIYAPVIAAIDAADGKICSVEQLAQAEACQNIDFWQIWESLLVLTGAGTIAPLDSRDVETSRTDAANSLNKFICTKSESLAGMQFLASPLIGSAVSVSWIDQIFLKALSDGVDDVPSRAWDILSAQGKRLIVDGNELAEKAENIDELQRLFKDLERTKLPILRSLGILPQK
jgi:SAM-dependent methyltransferase